MSGLITPAAPTHLRVHLTRLQVHQLFPRLRDRFPLAVHVPDRQGLQTIDVRDRLEVWPVSIEKPA